jgi:hypothetical protein
MFAASKAGEEPSLTVLAGGAHEQQTCELV